MKRILIAEDNAGFADFLATALRLAGCTVELAGDGTTAVERFRAAPFDLVLLDVLLPGQSGLWACSEIRGLPEGRDVPIVILSGVYRKKTDRQEAVRLGANEYLFKPIGVSEIWRILSRHLGISCQAGAHEADAPLPTPSAQWLGSATELRERPLAVVLHEQQRDGKTGLLFVNDGALTSIFFIDRGQLVFVRSNDADRRLGRVLRKLGRITEEQHDAALRLMQDDSRGLRLGEALVELGVLTREALHHALQHQLEALIVQAFEARSGCWRFVEGELPNREDIRVELDTDNIILKGIRVMPDETLLRRHLPDPGCVLRPLPSARGRLERLQLTSFERQVMSLVDGERTIEKVRSFGRLGQVSVDRMLFAFLNTGLVEAASASGPLDPDSGGAAPVRVAEDGSLATTSVPRLLADLDRAKASGVLRLKNSRHETWLYFDRGRLVFAGANDQHQRLGEILVEAGLLSEADLEEAGAAYRARKNQAIRLGQVLVEHGKVTLEELQWALVCQMQARIQTVFQWEAGEYQFAAGPLPTEETVLLDYETRDIVLEGVRRMDPYVVYRRLPPVTTEVRRAPDWRRACTTLRLMSSERRFLESLADRFTLTEPLDSDAFEPELTVKCLLGFLAVGLLEEAGTEPAEAPSAASERAEAERTPALVGAAPGPEGPERR
jgi:CheY-like chemotaxis protein